MQEEWTPQQWPPQNPPPAPQPDVQPKPWQDAQPAPQTGPQPEPWQDAQPAPQPGLPPEPWQTPPAPQPGLPPEPWQTPPAFLPFGRACSRVGWAFAVLMLLFTLGQLLFVWAFRRLLPGQLSVTLELWLCNDLALYGLGAPACWLLLRGLPRRLPPPCRPARYARMTLPWAGRLFCLGELCMIAGSLAGQGLMRIISYWAGAQGAGNPVAAALDGASVFTIFVFCVLVAPVGEELLFRGLLFRCLAPFGERAYILVSAALFSAFHGNFYQIPGAFLVGLLLAWLRCRTGRLRWGMLLHAAINFCGAVMPYLIAASDTLAGLWVLALLGFCIAGGVYLFRMRPARQLRAMPPLPGRPGAALLNPGMLAAALLSAVLLAANTLGSIGVLL